MSSPIVPDLAARRATALGDRYRLERELGGGGMSRVFLATERDLDRSVVVKILPEEAGSALSAERFTREIAVAAGRPQAVADGVGILRGVARALSCAHATWRIGIPLARP